MLCIYDLFTTLLTQTDSDEMDGEEDTSITTLPAVRRDRSASNAPRTPASSKANDWATVGFNLPSSAQAASRLNDFDDPGMRIQNNSNPRPKQLRPVNRFKPARNQCRVAPPNTT